MDEITIEICDSVPCAPEIDARICHSPSDAMFSPNSKRLLRRKKFDEFKTVPGPLSPSDGVMSPCSRKIFGIKKAYVKSTKGNAKAVKAQSSLFQCNTTNEENKQPRNADTVIMLASSSPDKFVTSMSSSEYKPDKLISSSNLYGMKWDIKSGKEEEMTKQICRSKLNSALHSNKSISENAVVITTAITVWKILNNDVLQIVPVASNANEALAVLHFISDATLVIHTAVAAGTGPSNLCCEVYISKLSIKRLTDETIADLIRTKSNQSSPRPLPSDDTVSSIFDSSEYQIQTHKYWNTSCHIPYHTDPWSAHVRLLEGSLDGIRGYPVQTACALIKTVIEESGLEARDSFC